MAAKGISSNRAFARACQVDDRRVTDWLNHRLPSADNLRQIAAGLGISVDWLLGFDVPMLRNKRSRIGALSLALDRLLTERRPTSAFAPELAHLESSEFATELIDDWWRNRLHARASDAAAKFRELAFEIQKAIRPSGESEDAVREGRNTINQCLWVAAKLESPLVEWDSVADFRFPHPATQHTYVSGAPQLATPFPVVGGWAFLWRYSKRDVAIYIEPGADWGEVGQVKVKAGTKRKPKFLIESPPISEPSKRRRHSRKSIPIGE